MLKVSVLVLDGVLDLSLGVTLDVLAAANRLRALRGAGPVFEVQLVGPVRRQVRTGNGLQLGPVRLLPATPADLVVVPGANYPMPDDLLAWLAGPQARRAARWLVAQSAAGARVAAGCASTFLLGDAGLLQDRTVTTTWWLAPLFRSRFARVDLDMDRMVVESGPVTTCGAALAQADLLLALVARHGSAELARDCARYLLLDRRLSQSRYALASHLVQQTPVMQRADRWIRQHLAGPITVEALATALHMTPRTLGRHFAAAAGQSPIRYVQRLRVEQARLLMETSALSLDEVATRVGYADASMLRRLLARAPARAAAAA